MMDAVTNAFIIIVFVWKFAPAILNPVWAFKSPLQALLAIGSMQHIVVGCVIASVYIVWKSKRNNFRFVFYLMYSFWIVCVQYLLFSITS